MIQLSLAQDSSFVFVVLFYLQEVLVY